MKRKIITLLLAVVMVFAMATVAFAAEPAYENEACEYTNSHEASWKFSTVSLAPDGAKNCLYGSVTYAMCDTCNAKWVSATNAAPGHKFNSVTGICTVCNAKASTVEMDGMNDTDAGLNDLFAAVNANGDGTYQAKLVDDETVATALSLDAGIYLEIDLNGETVDMDTYTITTAGEDTGNKKEASTLVLKNGTVKLSAAATFNGNVVLENVTLKGTGTVAINGNATLTNVISSAAITVSQAQGTDPSDAMLVATINGGIYTGTVTVSGTGALTIEDGTFTKVATDGTGKCTLIINKGTVTELALGNTVADSTVTVNDGTYTTISGAGVGVINGGTVTTLSATNAEVNGGTFTAVTGGSTLMGGTYNNGIGAGTVAPGFHATQVSSLVYEVEACSLKSYTVEATCITAGYTAQKCSVCGNVVVQNNNNPEVGELAAHTWTTKTVKDCQADSGKSIVKYCTVCYEVDSIKDSVSGTAVTAHVTVKDATKTYDKVTYKYNAFTANTTAVDTVRGGSTIATCTTPATTHIYCINRDCDFDLTFVDPTGELDTTGHYYMASDATATNLATCTTKGIAMDTCVYCGDTSKGDGLVSYGGTHSWATKTVDVNVGGTASNCATTIKTRVCARCGINFYDEVMAAYETAYKTLLAYTDSTATAKNPVDATAAANTAANNKLNTLLTKVYKDFELGTTNKGKFTATTVPGDLTWNVPYGWTDLTATASAKGYVVTSVAKNHNLSIVKDDVYTNTQIKACSDCDYEEIYKLDSKDCEYCVLGNQLEKSKYTVYAGIVGNCDVEGTTATIVCTCGETVVAAESTGLKHDPDKSTIVTAKAATCTEAGTTEGYECSKCDYVLEATEIAALGHDYEVTKEAVEATCTEAGMTAEKTCSVCGEVVEAEEVEALGHKFGEWAEVKAPTLAAEGSEERACSVCGEKETKAIAKLTLSFTDVKADDYFAEAVAWADYKDITTGKTTTTFAPNENCTRAQVVTFLWRAAGCPEPKSTNTGFSDVKADQYYTKAVAWAVENEITNGMGNGTFGVDETCTRAQVATFLWRLAGEPVANGAVVNPFTDVAANEYYTTAVRWAVDEGITNGTSTTTFSPDATCTRAQIVTFLYRYFN